jgi:hypothetical protein
MRSVTTLRRGRMAAGLLLTAVMAAGCAGSEASGGEISDVPSQPTASPIREERLLPGDQRVPGPTTVTTAARPWPLGKGSARPVTTTTGSVVGH